MTVKCCRAGPLRLGKQRLYPLPGLIADHLYIDGGERRVAPPYRTQSAGGPEECAF